MCRIQGGFRTKTHVNEESLGKPLRFWETAGQRHEWPKPKLWWLILICTADCRPCVWCGLFSAPSEGKSLEAVIPPRRNRKDPRTYDQDLYKERHLLECFFNKIKQYRLLFSRFDKLANGFLCFCLCWSLDLVTLIYRHNIVKWPKLSLNICFFLHKIFYNQRQIPKNSLKSQKWCSRGAVFLFYKALVVLLVRPGAGKGDFFF